MVVSHEAAWVYIGTSITFEAPPTLRERGDEDGDDGDEYHSQISSTVRSDAMSGSGGTDTTEREPDRPLRPDESGQFFEDGEDACLNIIANALSWVTAPNFEELGLEGFKEIARSYCCDDESCPTDLWDFWEPDPKEYRRARVDEVHFRDYYDRCKASVASADYLLPDVPPRFRIPFDHAPYFQPGSRPFDNKEGSYTWEHTVYRRNEAVGETPDYTSQVSAATTNTFLDVPRPSHDRSRETHGSSSGERRRRNSPHRYVPSRQRLSDLAEETEDESQSESTVAPRSEISNISSSVAPSSVSAMTEPPRRRSPPRGERDGESGGRSERESGGGSGKGKRAEKRGHRGKKGIKGFFGR